MPFVVTAVVVAAIASIAVWMVRPSEPRLVFRSTHLLPDGRRIRSLTRREIAISPDGRRLVYNGTGGLYLRDMDALDERIISGTEDALHNLSPNVSTPAGLHGRVAQGPSCHHSSRPQAPRCRTMTRHVPPVLPALST